MEKDNSFEPLTFRTHTKKLFEEIVQNGGPGCWVFHRPLQILYDTLRQVATRSAELNDLVLNALMCRLTLYTMADPTEPDYDPERLKRILEGTEPVKNKVTDLEDQVRELSEKIAELNERMTEGRSYLMSVEPEELTVEDALESFGYGRNGLNS